MIVEHEAKNAKIIETCLKSKLHVLQDNDYEYTKCVIEESVQLGNRYTFEFKSEKVKRIFELSYIPEINDTPSMLSVHITSLTLREFTENKRFDLETLINNRKLNYADNFFKKSVILDFSESKILDFINYLDEILIKDFLDIINGNKWEDVDFDWAGYK